MEEKQNTLAKNMATKNEIANAIGNNTISDSILANFNKLASQGQLVFPKGYNVGNQLKLMYTNLVQKNLIEGCTPISIGQALTEATIQGLEIDKNQVYFIKYGNKLQMFRAYFGDVAVAKQTHLVNDIRARVIYKGDEYELDVNEDGEEIISGHKTRLENKDNEIIGAYAWAELPNGKRIYCIMTIKEIKTSWRKSKTFNQQTSVHNEYPQEMAKRTVIRRLVKTIFNTSSSLSVEQEMVIDSYNRTTEEEYNNDYSVPNKKTTVNNTIEEVDNKQTEEEQKDIFEGSEWETEETDETEEEITKDTLF